MAVRTAIWVPIPTSIHLLVNSSVPIAMEPVELKKTIMPPLISALIDLNKDAMNAENGMTLTYLHTIISNVVNVAEPDMLNKTGLHFIASYSKVCLPYIYKIKITMWNTIYSHLFNEEEY